MTAEEITRIMAETVKPSTYPTEESVSAIMALADGLRNGTLEIKETEYAIHR